MQIRIFSLPSVLLLAPALLVTACDSTDPGEDGAGEEEVISNVTISLENTIDNSTVTAEAVFDEAGVKQSADTLRLVAGATYEGSITLRNRFENEDITAEIDDERDEHQFFYELLGELANAASVTITDTDSNGYPVGLAFSMTVAPVPGERQGDLRVVLGHYDERPKGANETINDIPETDIDFTYPAAVE
jgi:hypothetical protein